MAQEAYGHGGRGRSTRGTRPEESSGSTGGQAGEAASSEATAGEQLRKLRAAAIFDFFRLARPAYAALERSAVVRRDIRRFVRSVGHFVAPPPPPPPVSAARPTTSTAAPTNAVMVQVQLPPPPPSPSLQEALRRTSWTQSVTSQWLYLHAIRVCNGTPCSEPPPSAAAAASRALSDPTRVHALKVSCAVTAM